MAGREEKPRDGNEIYFDEGSVYQKMEDPNDASNLDPHSFFIALNVSSSDQGGSVTLDRILGRRSVGSSKTKYSPFYKRGSEKVRI